MCVVSCACATGDGCIRRDADDAKSRNAVVVEHVVVEHVPHHRRRRRRRRRRPSQAKRYPSTSVYSFSLTPDARAAAWRRCVGVGGANRPFVIDQIDPHHAMTHHHSRVDVSPTTFRGRDRSVLISVSNPTCLSRPSIEFTTVDRWVDDRSRACCDRAPPRP